MILRVWAMYNQSRLILGLLLVIYVINMILYLIERIMFCTNLKKNAGMSNSFVSRTLHNIHPNHIAEIVQVLDSSLCETKQVIPSWLVFVRNAVQTTLGILMCLLVANRLARDSLQMYKVTKQIQISRYMNLLARDGMLYFLAYVVFRPISFLYPQANHHYGQHLVFFHHEYAICNERFMGL